MSALANPHELLDDFLPDIRSALARPHTAPERLVGIRCRVFEVFHPEDGWDGQVCEAVWDLLLAMAEREDGTA